MTREDYIDLFHRAHANLVAVKQVFHCDEELRKMVEIAVADERDECACLCDALERTKVYGAKECAEGIRARGNT